MAQKVMGYLASGCNQVEAAKACGVDESLVSQYMREEDFREQVTEKLAKNFKDAVEIDNNYVETERILSDRLLKMVAPHLMNPDQILRTLKFVNDAKKKIAPNIQAGGNSPGGQDSGISLLVLPAFIVEAGKRELVLNPLNEVVGAGGRALNTFNSDGLNKLVAAKKAAQELIHGKIDGKSKAVFTIAAPSKQESSDPYSDL